MKIYFCFIITVFIFLLPDLNEAKTLRKKRLALEYFNIINSTPRVVRHIFENVHDLWQFFSRHPDSTLQDAVFRSKEKEMIEHYIKITSKLSALEQKVGNIADKTIDTIIEAFPKILRLELHLHELRQIINQINFADEQMSYYLILGYKNKTEKRSIRRLDTDFFSLISQNDTTNDINYIEKLYNNITRDEMDSNKGVEKFTLENFATWATGHDYNSLSSLLRRMNDLVAPNNTVGIFKLLKETSQESQANICDLKQSPYQTLYNLYNIIEVTELKAFAMIQFSYIVLRIFDKGDFKAEAELALSNQINYARQKIEALQEVLPDTERSYYACDPKQFVEGVTYTKLTNLLQGYIENEVNISPDGSCSETCDYYSNTKYYGCYKNEFCNHQPQCKGKILDCQYVQADMTVCSSSTPTRRYDWVEYKYGKILGSKGYCEKKNTHKVNSWWRYLVTHCTYCLCLCDDESLGSDRFFSLRNVEADIDKNKVVTGIRIVKEKQIIHLQIQQGVLGPRGIIEKDSLSWKPVDAFSIGHSNVKNGEDYHTMDWMNRALDLDDLVAPFEHVVTGVRFRKIGSNLNLEIRVSPMNFTTGQVFEENKSYWLGNDNTPVSSNPRTEIKLPEPDIPIRHGPHYSYSRSNQFVQFQPTSFVTDLGQSTVPFLDSQVVKSQGFPLAGVGLIHRGKPGSGGFVAPKLITYDYVRHLRFD